MTGAQFFGLLQFPKSLLTRASYSFRIIRLYVMVHIKSRNAFVTFFALAIYPRYQVLMLRGRGRGGLLQHCVSETVVSCLRLQRYVLFFIPTNI
nr:MAG TPA: hypothetical protein [Caudoviricetes sp.]